MHKICPKDALRVDLVDIDCVIYSIAAWEVFDYDYFEEQRWPGPEDLKPANDIMCGEIIKKCWYGKYSSMKVLHDDVIELLGSCQFHDVLNPQPASPGLYQEVREGPWTIATHRDHHPARFGAPEEELTFSPKQAKY
jgi:hypothetical protein